MCQCVFRTEDGLFRLHQANDSLLSSFGQELLKDYAKLGRRRARSHDVKAGHDVTFLDGELANAIHKVSRVLHV